MPVLPRFHMCRPPVLDLLLGRYPGDTPLLAAIATAILAPRLAEAPTSAAGGDGGCLEGLRAAGGFAVDGAGCLSGREALLVALLEKHPAFSDSNGGDGGGPPAAEPAGEGTGQAPTKETAEPHRTNGRAAAHTALAAHAARLFHARRFGAATRFYAASLPFVEVRKARGPCQSSTAA